MGKTVAIIGGGCAGLGSGYYLRNTDYAFEVHEATDRLGGIAGSLEWHGFHMDIAPHRLFTRHQDILQELLDLVPMRQFERHSRIFLQGKWITDPVNPIEMVVKYSPRQSFDMIWNFLFKKKVPEDSFEALVLNKFGSGLNRMFFKPYSEKLFGIPASEIDAAWGRRKIRVSGFLDMLKRNTKLYFNHFYYPESGGYGAICERFREVIGDDRIHRNSKLVALEPRNGNRSYRCTFEQNGRRVEKEYDYVISSLPVNTLAGMLGLDVDLTFRPAKLVYLLISKHMVTRNHWFYFADADYIINRCAEFKNFGSGEFGADRTVLCCEVTALERGFSVSRVVQELVHVHLIKPGQVIDAMVMDLDLAYPIYRKGYEDELRRAENLFAGHPHLFRLGRHGLFAHKDIDEVLLDAKKILAGLLD